MPIPSAFTGPTDRRRGRSPVVIDIIAPDFETSLLPDNLKMVLHVNPRSMKFTYQKIIERIQTKGGFVEQHFGDGAESISFENSTGGFMRLFTGPSNITGDGRNVGGSRRETIAYDKYLDMLALFHNNGGVYDITGQIIFQGIIKILFDGFEYFGWFQNLSVTEAAEKPYQFELSTQFTLAKEVMGLRSLIAPRPFTDFDPENASSDQTLSGTPLPQAEEALPNNEQLQAFTSQINDSFNQTVSGLGASGLNVNLGRQPAVPTGTDGFETPEG